MTTVEYNDIRIKVPDNWDDITLGDYERISGQRPQTAKDRASLVAGICHVGVDILLDWPAEVFNRIVDITGFLYADTDAVPASSVEIDGIMYAVSVGDKFTLGAWIDADEVQKNGQNVLSGVLAIVCRPVGEKYDCNNNEARQKLFAAQPVSRLLPVLAFFLRCKKTYEQRMRVFSRLTQGIALLVRSTQGLRPRGAGIRLSRIWLTVRFWILTVLLRYRLKMLLHTSSSAKIKPMRKRHSAN